MLCDFIADKLFRKNIADSEIDPAMLEAMKNHTFIDTILSWFKRIVEKSKNHPLQAELIKMQNDIEQLYKKASKQGFADGEVKYSKLIDSSLEKYYNKKAVKTTKSKWSAVNSARMQRYSGTEDIPYIDVFDIAEYNKVNVAYSYVIRNVNLGTFEIVGIRKTKGTISIKKRGVSHDRINKEFNSTIEINRDERGKNDIGSRRDSSDRERTERSASGIRTKSGDYVGRSLGSSSGYRGTSGLKHNISNKTNRKAESNVRTNEFRELQEASRRLSNKDVEAFHNGSKTVDDGIRRQLSMVFRREISNTNGLLWNGNTSVVNAKTNKKFDIIKNVDAKLFYDIFEIVQKHLRSGDAVDLHSVQDYKNTKNYLSEDGLSGFSITKEGDLISVFSLSKGGGFLQAIREFVKQEGAKTLDCFNSDLQNLPLIYSKTLGFKTASVLDFNYDMLVEDKGQEYADYFVETYGKAPVAFMVNTDADVQTKHFNKDQYDEALEYRNSFIEAGLDNSAFSNGEKYSLDVKLDDETFDGEVYGTIPPGEKPARVVRVPKKVDGTYTNRFVRTIMEHGDISEFQVELLKDGVLHEAEKFRHEVVKDKSAIEYAQNRVKDGSAEEEFRKFADGIIKKPGYMKKKNAYFCMCEILNHLQTA